MEPEDVAFALRRLWGTARSRLATSIAVVLDAASKRSSPSQFSASLVVSLVSAPWWMTSLVLAAVLWCLTKIGSVALTRRRRKSSNHRWRRRRRHSGVGGNGDDEDAAAERSPAIKGGRAGRYGLLDDDGNDDEDDNDRGSAGYEDDYASDPDDSATTLASRAREEEEHEGKAAPTTAAPFFPNPKNVAGLLLRQPSVVSRGQQQQQVQQAQQAQQQDSSSSSLHVARLEASPEFKNFLKSRGLTPEHAAAARRRLGAYRELRAADPPSFRTLLLSSSSAAASKQRNVEEGVEAAPLSALELLVDSAAGGAGCGALALLWWCRVLLSWLLSSSSSSAVAASLEALPPPAAAAAAFRWVPPAPLAASTALALAGLASAALLGRPFALSLLFSSKRYWWEESRGDRAGTPSEGRRAALAFSLDAAAFGAATLGLGSVAGAAARCLGVPGGERTSLGERGAGVGLVKERRYRALAAAAE